MKKLLVILAAVALVWGFTATAMAVDWNFYGSARMKTFWVDRDYGDGPNDAGNDDEDADLQWDLQGNSRIGAKVKAESVSGQFELGLKGDGAGDLDVGTRRIYGVWDFGAGKLKVGKDYTPISQFISGQIFDDDLGLLGIGTMYGNRTGQISLTFGGFEIAFITPTSGEINNIAGVSAGGDVDEYLPKFEASYGMGFDQFNFAVRGGYQRFTLEDVTSLVDGDNNDVDVDAWIIGADFGLNFGPGYFKGALSYGQNVGNAEWNLAGLRTFGGYAVWDGDDDTKDTDSLMGAAILGWRVHDQLTLEAGFGYRYDDPDVDNSQKDDAWEIYAQAVMTLAPGVYIIPEIGYTDYGQSADENAFGPGDDDEGNQWYAGAKWQIDF
ncbi:MAG: hypothetical protein JSW39_24535 [Desulfobacterales bacterium]|nr:MAG: hypothetical protein JSW39_24535 [Desulfobacterales bacterium]